MRVCIGDLHLFVILFTLQGSVDLYTNTNNVFWVYMRNMKKYKEGSASVERLPLH